MFIFMYIYTYIYIYIIYIYIYNIHSYLKILPRYRLSSLKIMPKSIFLSGSKGQGTPAIQLLQLPITLS